MIRDNPTRWNSVFLMLQRALYLRKAIEYFLRRNPTYDQYKLSTMEWKQVEFLVYILHPFQACSSRLEGTTRPGIAKVFWVYESLFNELDRLSDLMEDPENSEHQWLKALKPALDAMVATLQKYYNKTSGKSVYFNGVLFEPRSKLSLFRQASWTDVDIQAYLADTRELYVEEYESRDTIRSPRLTGYKRPYSEMTGNDDEDDDEEFERTLQSLPTPIRKNELDEYISSDPLMYKVQELDYWRQASCHEYKHLGVMVRDTLAVPATGAGVERLFSFSGLIGSKLRGRLNASTMEDIMMYRNWMARRKRNVQIFPAAGLGAGEEPVQEENDDVPKDWKDQWWKEQRTKGRRL